MSDARSIPVHVQVIDAEPFRLSVTIPAYLTVRDLTTRVARDAGLEAFWPDGRRRTFYLRARGRLLLPDEKLASLGIVDHELLHLLPEPPGNSGIVERPARYRESTSRPKWRDGVGIGLSALGLLAFAVADGIAVSASRSTLTQGLGALGIGLLSTGLARRVLGPPGSAWRVLGLAAAIGLPLAGLAALGSLGADLTWGFRGVGFLAAAAGVLSGLLIGWMAWHEPVESLPDLSPQQAHDAKAARTWACAVCQLPVTVDQKQDCQYGCGRVLHPGCQAASQSLSPNTRRCTVCGEIPA
ncbi:MAG: EsaB/YukD family protein [Myxococcota bacterium]